VVKHVVQTVLLSQILQLVSHFEHLFIFS